ncbi:MAG: MFS transporter, partial [Alphaproteobacteria bacterium]|nr:MFS transporter [Alphaproteobacteria bacterium]
MTDAPTFRARAATRLGLADMGAALAFKSFRLYIATNCVSLIGLWVQRIAIQALAWQLTHSATWLGIIALVDLAPALVFGPVAGAMADRFNRRRLTYITQCIAMAQAALLAGLTLAGFVDIWILFALTMAGGINTAFWGPVRQSIVPNMVPRPYLSTAVAMGALNFNLARFIGPALAGPVIVFANIGTAFAINAASYLAFLVALHWIEFPPGPHEQRAAGEAPPGSLFADTIDGITYVVRHKGIGPFLLLLSVGGMALRPLVELLAGFADRVHGQGMEGFALLTLSMGAGALLGAVWLTIVSSRVDHLRTVIWSGIAGGMALILLALVPTFSFALFGVGLAAVALTVNGVSSQIMLQLAVPDAMRGRVLSLYQAIFRGTPALGALIIGAVADLTHFA